MKYFHITESPIEIRGLYGGGESGGFERFPAEVAERVSDGVKWLARRNTGGRARFRTNSKSVYVKVTLKTLGVDICMALSGSAGADVFLGRGLESKYVCLVQPRAYGETDKVNEKTFVKSCDMEQVTINMPRNELVGDMIIGIEDGAELLPPLPYTYEKPVIFYGSSITEGGCCCRPGNAYTSMVSRWLDADHRNFGFSGNGRGETSMAEYIAGLEMSAFVYDYDHNAPSVEHLSSTHENFFKIIRAAQPDLPVLMMSKPDFDPSPEANAKRREVIRRTYDNAVATGDKNVYFLDGESFFGDFERSACTVDGCHPNDLGFFRMSQVVYPVLKGMLEDKS